MSKLQDEIRQMEAALAKEEMERSGALDPELTKEDLARYRYVQGVWESLEDVPMDPATECIEAPFTVYHQSYGDGPARIDTVFPAGTHREDIWHWMERTFCVSVAVDLMD